ncbi:MAG: DUF2628 domain-containing protein [Ruminococcus albus]|nr:DUF2628 domain-containing protein [Ruminococcus albus]
MTKYTGSKCISCGERFADGDDIVVCPECGTPYHRECYIKEGKCINTSLHEKKVSWLPDGAEETTPVAASSVKRCIRCGAENPAELRYCEQCGTPLINMDSPRPFNEEREPLRTDHENDPLGESGFTAVTLNQDSDIDGVTLGDLARYVGTNPIGFLPSFIRFAKTGRKISMNFFAFLFTPVYFMFRKMKGWGIAAAIIMALLSVPDMIVLLSSGEYYDFRIDLGIDIKSHSFVLLTQIMLYLTMVLKLLAGFFANYIYYKQARRDITKIRAQGEDKQADDLNREIILAGGTSLGNVLLAYLIYTMISFGSIVLIGKLM